MKPDQITIPKIHAIGGQHASFLTKIRTITRDETIVQNEDSKPASSKVKKPPNKKVTPEKQELLTLLDSYTETFANARSCLEVKSDFEYLEYAFKEGGLHLWTLLHDKFDKVKVSDPRKTAYARMLLMFPGYMPIPMDRIISSDHHKKHNVSFCMDFLKSLTLEDKKEFIQKATASTIRHVGTLCKRFIEITDEDPEKAKLIVAETIIGFLREFHNRTNAELCTDVRAAGADFIPEKELQALYVMDNLEDKAPFEDLVTLYDITTTTETLLQSSKLLKKLFGERAADVFLEIAKKVPERRWRFDLEELDRQRRFNAILSYFEIKQEDSFDDLTKLLRDKDPLIVSKVILMLLDKETFGTDGKEHILSLIKDRIENGRRSRALLCLTILCEAEPVMCDLIEEIFSHDYRNKEALADAYKMNDGKRACSSSKKKDRIFFDLDLKSKKLREIIKPIGEKLTELAISENTVAQANAISVLNTLSARELEWALNDEALEKLRKASGIAD